MRSKVHIRVKFLKLEKTCTFNELLRHKLHCHINYTILICICKFRLPRKGAIIQGKCFLFHLHAKFLFSFEYVQSDSTVRLIFYAFQISNTFIVFE